MQNNPENIDSISNKVQPVMLMGEVGKIEGMFLRASNPNAPAVLVLHPDPVHGGTMRNKVVHTMYKSFAKAGYSVLRINFRGVGKSQGNLGSGGEVIDASFALVWLESYAYEASSFWVAGFSKGAWVAMQLVMRRPEVSGFIVSGLPISRFDWSFLSPCPVKGLILHGAEDQLFIKNDVYKFYEKLGKQRNAVVEFQSIDGANHYFDGKLDELSDYCYRYLKWNAHPNVGQTKIKRRSKKNLLG